MSANYSNHVSPLWSTADRRGNLAEVLAVNSKTVHTGPIAHPRAHVAGTMRVQITVWRVNDDTEDILYRALDTLIDGINDFPEDAAQLFDAQNIRLDDRFSLESDFRQIDPCTFVATLKWTGDAIPDCGPLAHPLGYYEWANSRGIR